MTIINYLEKQVREVPNNNAFISDKGIVTYSELYDKVRRVGSAINEFRKPVLLYLDKSLELVYSMLGVVYSGNYYVVGDTHMPDDRLQLIIDNVEPAYIITDKRHASKFNNPLLIEELLEHEILDISEKRSKIVDTDIMYILYTSGSTGVPKGTILNHKAVLSYLDWFTEEFNINHDTIFGSQTQFYFSMSISDFYGTIYKGSSLVLIPKMYFSFPIKLVEMLEKYNVNTLYWTPSGLSILVNSNALDKIRPNSIKNILFAGEVMPVKIINKLKKYYNDALYANLFGPTETVDICTFYKLDREFRDDEVLPIGISCKNCDCFLLDDDNKLSNKGELVVRGSFLATGYYKNPEKTKSSFVQNPLNNLYDELIYRTGDIVHIENGIYYYDNRKDFQIKKNGYRIELGEIEYAANLVIEDSIAVYDNTHEVIGIFYLGNMQEEELIKELREKIPSYMMPDKVIKIERITYNANGKKDRNYYKKTLEDLWIK